MAVIFGAPPRAHLHATLTQPLQLSGKSDQAQKDFSPSVSLQAEGWGVFDCGERDDGTPRLELQRLDNPPGGTPAFRSDQNAWEHVVRHARAGSCPYQRALRMVDPVERLAIEATCGWCPGPKARAPANHRNFFGGVT